MQRIILGHSLNNSTISTLQMLLSYTTSSAENSHSYVDACADLLKIMSPVTLVHDDSAGLLMQTAAQSMSSIANVLLTTTSVSLVFSFL